MSKHVKTFSIVLSFGLISMVQAIPVNAGKQINSTSIYIPWNDNGSAITLENNRILNTSSIRELNLHCPILHQNFNTFSGDNLNVSGIDIIDISTTHNTICWVSINYHIDNKLYGDLLNRYTVSFGSYEKNFDLDGTDRYFES